jgi:hypothetical protein
VNNFKLPYWACLLGAVIGFSIGWANIWVARPNLRTMTQAELEANIAKQAEVESPVLIDVTVRPDWNDGYIVSGRQFITYLGNGLYEPFECRVPRPFISVMAQQEGADNRAVQDFPRYLEQATRLNPGFSYRYSWWAGQFGILLKFSIGGALLGFVWPLAVQLLVTGRIEIRPRESRSALAPTDKIDSSASSAQPVSSATFSENLDRFLELTASVKPELSTSPQAHPEPKSHDVARLSSTDQCEKPQVNSETEEEHFRGDYYPTALHDEDQ